jgi:hypothetical protein
VRYLAILLLLVGCDPTLGNDDDDSGPPVPEGCPDEDLYEAESCDDTYCGLPAVRLGTGGANFMEMEDGGPIDVHFGPQGGYHMFLSAEMERLCAIVFLETTMDVYVDGERHEIFNQTRHVQAVRPAPDVTSLQQYWGIQGLVPCNLYPDDPDHDQPCGTFRSRLGHIEDFEVTVTLRAEDHDGRSATEIKTLQPVCCAE